MSRKAFYVGIDVEIHAVTCPGVWLCPKGEAMLRVSMLGASCSTKRVEPTFPLLFHECFHFRKTLTGISSLADLQTELSKYQVNMQLLQFQVHGCHSVPLAVFRSPLMELLYPQPASRGLIAGVDVDLLMEPTDCFPGIISPKVEVSTKVIIEELVNYTSRYAHEKTVFNNKTISSKRVNGNEKEKTERKGKSKMKATVNGSFRQRGRQKPVCHTKPCVKCYNCKQPVRGRGKGPATRPHYTPYCNSCGDFEETESKQGKVILKENSLDCGKWETMCPCSETQLPESRVCDCNLCRKYDQLFGSSPTPSPRPSDLQSLKLPKWKSDGLQLQSDKGNPCPCPCPCSVRKSEDPRIRVRAGLDDAVGRECQCKRCPDCAFLQGIRNPPVHDQRQKLSSSEDQYKNMFRTDLDSHYKKMFDRVSQRSNKRGS